MNKQTLYTYLILGAGAAVVCGFLLAVGLVPLDAFSIAISAAMFLAVAMLVAAVFSQPGKVQMSPQREAAIATGHTDRRTIFEQPLLRPLMWSLLMVAHRLSAARAKEWIRRQLVAAGSPNFYTSEEYLALSILVGLIVAFVFTGVELCFQKQFSSILMIVGLAAGIAGYLFQLHDTAGKRTRLISRRLPYALDLVSLAMGAGATFTEAVRTVVRQQDQDPFNVELRTLLAEMDLGSTRKKALQNLADRVPLDSLRSIVASVVQSEELGTSLGPTMHDQASLLRMQRSVRAENAAAVASVRILIPCLLLMIAVILMVFGPFILRVLSEGMF